MTCPRCFSELDRTGATCPECGTTLYRKVTGIVRTSAVLISAGEDHVFYDSVQEVPERLRKQLLATTASANSGTIVIADRAGKEQLTQVLARRESSRERAAAAEAKPVSQPPASRLQNVSWIAWAGFALVLILAAVFAAFFELHW